MNKPATPDISITVETEYLDDQSVPGQDRYVFAYTINILNNGSTGVKLISRHWLITDANNKLQEVRGDGVIGQQPHILPGHSYRYTSGAVLETPIGCMEGSYHMVTDDDIGFEAAIPLFSLASRITMH